MPYKNEVLSSKACQSVFSRMFVCSVIIAVKEKMVWGPNEALEKLG